RLARSHACCCHAVAPRTTLLLLPYARTLHRNLHPFPTRRSSDLKNLQKYFDCNITIIDTYQQTGVVDIAHAFDWLFEFLSESTRSEEHTSELQSLRHLVCRLLLEKKNQHAHESRRRSRDVEREGA